MKDIFFLVFLLADPFIPLRSQPARGGVAINEILFNPVRDGFDYVEGFNTTNTAIDLSDLLIANRNAAGDLSGKKEVSPGPLELPPGRYFVVTANEKWLRQHYQVTADAIVCQVSSLPSFPDDQGTVAFLDRNDSVIDELSYDARWQFPLINDPSGVALERIDAQLPTQDRNNWASAASSSGYGTPGSRNSQWQGSPGQNREIEVPHLFSPDNDGSDDVALVRFNMREPGFVASAAIYDVSGRRVRYLLKNETLGNAAAYKWDGLDDRSQALPQGIYILVTEMFRLTGEMRRFRNAIVLARK